MSRRLDCLHPLGARASHPFLPVFALFISTPATAQLAFTETAAPLGVVHTFSPATGYPGSHGPMVGALTVGDFNRDGWPDLYALGGGNQPDRLFINTGGTFEDRSADWNLPAPHRGVSAAVGDVNGDGWPDLFIVSYGSVPAGATPNGCMLLLNRGGFFEDVSAAAGLRSVANTVDGMGAVFGDIDNDGDLDLFVCAWFAGSGGNRLFINTGNNADGVPIFVDATPSMGVSLTGLRGFTPRMIDLNADGLPELLLTADYGTSRLLLNLGPGADGMPRFADLTPHAGITADTNGMGADLADIDNDGDLDWFITNIYGAFSGTTNTLYLNTGLDQALNAPRFQQHAAAAGVHHNGWGWGAVFADFDHDGDCDLAATGGWSTYPPTPARLYENLGVDAGVPRFQDVAQSSGFAFTGLGRTLVTLDFDRDGDLDLAMSVNSGPLRLFRNDTQTQNAWVIFELDSSRHPCLPPEGRHARVEVDAGGRTQVRVLDGGPTYLGQSEMIVHFGLGDASRIDALRVLWPDGTLQRFDPPPLNQRTPLIARHPADFNADGRFDEDDIPLFLASFTLASPDADLNADGLIDLRDVVRFVHALLGDPCDTSHP